MCSCRCESRWPLNTSKYGDSECISNAQLMDCDDYSRKMIQLLPTSSDKRFSFTTLSGVKGVICGFDSCGAHTNNRVNPVSSPTRAQDALPADQQAQGTRKRGSNRATAENEGDVLVACIICPHRGNCGHLTIVHCHTIWPRNSE